MEGDMLKNEIESIMENIVQQKKDSKLSDVKDKRNLNKAIGKSSKEKKVTTIKQKT